MMLRPGLSAFLFWHFLLALCIRVGSLRGHHHQDTEADFSVRGSDVVEETDLSVTARGIAIHKRITNASSPSPPDSRLVPNASSPMPVVQLVVGSQAARNSTDDELNRPNQRLINFWPTSQEEENVAPSRQQSGRGAADNRHTATAFVAVKQGIHTLVSALAKPFRAEFVLFQADHTLDTGSSGLHPLSMDTSRAPGSGRRALLRNAALFFAVLLGVACCASMCMDARTANDTGGVEDNAPASDEEAEKKVRSTFRSAFKKGAKSTGGVVSSGVASLGLGGGMFTRFKKDKKRDETDKDDAGSDVDSDVDVSNYY